MDTTPNTTRLAAFRQRLYRGVLGRRKDSLCDLLDAVVSGAGPVTLVRHTLSPLFRRRWASAPDALADGTLDAAACRRLVLELAPQPADEERLVWALDGTAWPRPAASTSAERTWTQQPQPGLPSSILLPGWEYQWLWQIAEAGTSWALPLDVARRGPQAGTATELALVQVRRVLAAAPAAFPRPVVTADSQYDLVALARASRAEGLAVDWLVRLPRRRRLYRAPGAYRGRGRRPIHGRLLKLWEPETLGASDASLVTSDTRHGQVQVAVWRDVHRRDAADCPFTLVRVQVERLPRAGRTPRPLWLAWAGAHEPQALEHFWQWYAQRFVAEHGNRFLKHDLGWTTIRVRDPLAAERWSWLLLLSIWLLWLGRALVSDQRLPWERVLAPGRLTPGRVRRGMGSILAAVGTPARAPRPRGNAPGRALGERPSPPVHYAVTRRRTRGPPHKRTRA